MFKIIILLLGMMVLGGCSLSSTYSHKNEPLALKQERLPLIKIGSAELLVEVAKSNAERSRGLSGRKFLAENQGMIFIFDKPARYSFWMKGMNFPLDFIWLEDGRVVELSVNIPAPSSNNSVPVTIKPAVPADAVIEVNAGWVSEQGITIGQEVIGLTGL